MELSHYELVLLQQELESNPNQDPLQLEEVETTLSYHLVPQWREQTSDV